MITALAEAETNLCSVWSVEGADGRTCILIVASLTCTELAVAFVNQCSVTLVEGIAGKIWTSNVSSVTLNAVIHLPLASSVDLGYVCNVLWLSFSQVNSNASSAILI